MRGNNQWIKSTVGELFKVVGGGTPATKNAELWDGSTPWITSADLYENEGIRIRRTISSKGITQSTTNLVPAGSVIVATRVGLGKVGVAQVDLCFSQDCHGLIINSKICDSRFAGLQLKVRVQDFKKVSRGTTIAGVTKKQLLDVVFNLPPLEIQRGIADEIEKQFTRLDAGVAALRRVQANLKRYRAAVLKAACEGAMIQTHPVAQQVPLSQLIETMDQGWSPKCETHPSENHTTWAVIKTTAIQNLRFIEHENKQLPKELNPRPNLELLVDDLLMTRAGPRSRVGVACLVRQTRPKLMLCDKAYRIRCKVELVLPAFLELVLNSPSILHAVNKLKTGISDSGVNLTQKGIKDLRVPLPSLDIQEQIVVEAERRLSIVHEMESVVNANLQRASRLRVSILHNALLGKVI